MPKSEFINFVEEINTTIRKTTTWRVVTLNKTIGVTLGHVKWYSHWRKYCYFPNQGLAIVLDKTCLREIATFCDDETKLHYQKYRMAKDKAAGLITKRTSLRELDNFY